MNTVLLKLSSWISLLRRWGGSIRRKPSVTVSQPPQTAPALPSPLVACITVVIPALNEAARIAGVVRHALADAATAEVIVVDDSSIDDTVELAQQAGAKVITSTMLGKGTSMRDGVNTAQCEWIVFLDGDLTGLRPNIVTDLCRPLLCGEADLVKARFGRVGGRVTELTAKPMLKVFFPELADFAQPLGGLVAARTTLLKAMNFESGYGVDIGLLIDAHRAGARLAEVDIGSLEHDSQPLLDLTAMANEVSRVIYTRARAAGRLHTEQIVAMYESQRQATATLDYILSRRRSRTRVILLDMDGTVTTERYVVQLARATGLEGALAKMLDSHSDSATRSERIAETFKFIHQQQFERVAHAMPIRPGVIECVNRLRRAGFMVGLVSDSYFVAAEIIRRRIFADFALAHTIRFDGEVCSGALRLNDAFMARDGEPGPAICKSHVVRRLREDAKEPTIAEVWALGDNLNDMGMLQAADRSFTIDPKSPLLTQVPGVTVLTSFTELSGALAPGQLKTFGQAA
jgi:glucosyl-3-phosphoglycerate synthase